MTLSQTARASTVAITTEFSPQDDVNALSLPQHIGLLAQGSDAAVFPLERRRIFSAQEAARIYGAGSPIHLAARQFFPVGGGGVGTVAVTVLPVETPGNAVASTASIEVTSAPTRASEYRIRVGNDVSIAAAAAPDNGLNGIARRLAAGVNSNPDMPVTATSDGDTVTLTAKWSGASGNALSVAVEGPTDLGATFGVTAFSGGLITPSIDDALGQIGETFMTLIVSGFSAGESDVLDALQNIGEGRWGPLTRRPYVAFTGLSATSFEQATAVSSGRGADRINSIVNAPGSPAHPVSIAAGIVSRIARQAHTNPPVAYNGQPIFTLEPGPEQAQFSYAVQDAVLQAGTSTSEVRDGVIRMGDIVTCFAPEGNPNPEFRYVVDIIKLQNVIFNFDLVFSAPEWAGAPLVPDGVPVTNPRARTPAAARAASISLVNSLGLDAILTNAAQSASVITAGISPQNNRRLDIRVPIFVTGNTDIKNVELLFSFVTGGN